MNGEYNLSPSMEGVNMRDIIFRGKREDNGEWVYGFAYKQHSFGKIELWYIRTFGLDFLVIPETVGQYTGLTDKNGVKIFEGDIVEIKDFSQGVALNYKQPTSKWVVKWYEKTANFGIDYMAIMAYKYFNECEVIGNVHDNPELLKGGNNNG